MPSGTSVGQLLHFWRIGKGTHQADGRLTILKDGRFQLTARASLPSTCVVGRLCTNGADANKLYQCTTTNTWTKVGTQA